MISFMQSVFGEYTPHTVINDGVITPIDGLAGADWQYIGSVAIFCIFLFCVFKFIGGLFHK